MSKFDVIYYTPATKLKVLPLLKFPDLAERTARSIYGVRLAPGQPRPGDFKGPVTGWSGVWGNFLGYEKDPALMHALLDLTELEFGLVGGTFKPSALDTQRFKGAIEQDLQFEAGQRDNLKKTFGERLEQYEAARNNETLRFLVTVARAQNVKNPLKLSIPELFDIQTLAIIKGDITKGALDKWIKLKCGSQPTEDTAARVNIEQIDDWEEPLLSAYSAMVAPTAYVKEVKKKAA